jgi:hypothetical protein
MKSANFEILRSRWPELAELGGFAEAYALADPASALVKLRLFAENLTKDIYRDLVLRAGLHSTRPICPSGHVLNKRRARGLVFEDNCRRAVQLGSP